jgi:hypothetical protein
MKDALIVFIVALILGSLWNGFQADNQTESGDSASRNAVHEKPSGD